MEADRRQRLQEQVVYWNTQCVNNEHERRRLGRAAGVLTLLSAAAGLWRWQATAWGLVTALLLWGLAMYMTWVRRGEFRQEARDAQAALEALPPAAADR